MEPISKIVITISRNAPRSVVGRASRPLTLICLAAMLNGLVVGVSACSSSHKVSHTLHQSDRGKVSLEGISNRSFQAAHPITLPVDTIALVLRGVLVRDDQGALTEGRARRSEALRAFPEEDVVFLAPLIVEGLKRAASDQQVGFSVNQRNALLYPQRVGTAGASSKPPLQPASPGSTTGFMYAYGRSLYLTLTQYRFRDEGLDTLSVPNGRIPDRTGLMNHTVLFVPELAKRGDTYRDSPFARSTLVIDYELLPRIPTEFGSRASNQTTTAAGPTGDQASAAQEPPAAKGGAAKKDPEIEALRKELEEIKKQLAEQSQRNPAQPQTPITPRSP